MLIISSHGKVTDWCVTCGARAEMIPLSEAALLARVDARTLFRWVEAEKVHSTETTRGSLMICVGSLNVNQT